MSIHPLITSSHPHTTTHTHCPLVQVCMCACSYNRISDLQFIYGPLLLGPLTTCQHPQTMEHYNDDTHTQNINTTIHLYRASGVTRQFTSHNSPITIFSWGTSIGFSATSLYQPPLFHWMLLLNRDSQVDKHMERSVSYENILTVESDAHIHPPNSNPLCISFQSTSRAFFHENPNIFPLHSQWKLGNWNN